MMLREASNRGVLVGGGAPDGPSSLVRRAKPLRVLYVEANEDGTVGGSHQLVYDLARSVPRDRIDPVVLFYQNNAFVDRLRSHGVTVLLYDHLRVRERAVNATGGLLRRRAEQVAAIGRRFQLLRQQNIGLVHLNNSPTVGVDDWLPAAICANTPCVVNAGGLLGRDRRFIHRALTRRFARVIAVSEYMAAALRERGYPERQIECVNLSVDIARLQSRVSASRTEIRTSLNIRPDRVVITMVGNVRQWKGQHVLLEAVELLLPAVRERVHVLFAGAVSEADRSYFAHLQQIVERAHLGDRVQFLGARDDVADLLAASDVAVHASILPEPFGLVIIEAMALGTPVVAARLGAPRDIVTSASGLLYDPESPRELAERLTELVLDADLRKRLGKGAIDRAKDFGVVRYISQIMAVYEKVAPARDDERLIV